MRALLTALIGLVLLTVSARAVEPTASCTLQSAIPATVRDILRDYRPYLDKCVRIRGFVAWRALYDSTQRFYRRAGDPTDLPEPGSIALYGSGAVSQDWLWAYRSGAELVGTISACELIDATSPDPNVIVMVIGNCHYHGGPLIRTVEVHPDAGFALRLFGPEAYRQFGSLKPVQARALPHRNRASIRAFFDAIRGGNPKALKSLLHWTFTSRDGELDDAMNPARSPYAFLIGRVTPPPIQYFTTTAEDPNDRDSIGCVCKTADCRNAWPIAEADSTPREAWPYACVEVYPGGGIAF